MEKDSNSSDRFLCRWCLCLFLCSCVIVRPCACSGSETPRHMCVHLAGHSCFGRCSTFISIPRAPAWRLLCSCSSFLVMTCSRFRDYSILPMKELHRRLQGDKAAGAETSEGGRGEKKEGRGGPVDVCLTEEKGDKFLIWCPLGLSTSIMRTWGLSM